MWRKFGGGKVGHGRYLEPEPWTQNETNRNRNRTETGTILFSRSERDRTKRRFPLKYLRHSVVDGCCNVSRFFRGTEAVRNGGSLLSSRKTIHNASFLRRSPRRLVVRPGEVWESGTGFVHRAPVGPPAVLFICIFANASVPATGLPFLSHPRPK